MIEQLRPEPHPTKNIFKKNRISQALIGRALKCSRAKVNYLLNGYITPQAEENKILNQIVEELKR